MKESAKEGFRCFLATNITQHSTSIPSHHTTFKFRCIQNTFLLVWKYPNPKQNHWSSLGEHLNLNPKLVFCPVRFRFRLKFGTELSHHYAGIPMMEHSKPGDSIIDRSSGEEKYRL